MDVEWINLTDPMDVIKAAILNTRHSKLICCNEDLDNFLGILNIKDYLVTLSSGDTVVINDLLIQPLIVAENTDARGRRGIRT